MNPMNDIVNTALKSAMAALHHLNDSGCTVFGIEIRQRRPVIQIDQPSGPFLQGALKSRTTINGQQRCVLVMSVHGCQVEWTETYPAGERAHAQH